MINNMNESIFEINSVEYYKDIIIICENIFTKSNIEKIRNIAINKYKYNIDAAFGKLCFGFLNQEIKNFWNNLFKIKFNLSCFDFHSTFLWKDIFYREFIHIDSNGDGDDKKYASVTGLNIDNFEKTYTEFYEFIEEFNNKEFYDEIPHTKGYCQRKIGRIRQNFNKTYFYNSSIFHSPSNGYGTNENDSRLGYNIFFKVE